MKWEYKTETLFVSIRDKGVERASIVLAEDVEAKLNDFGEKGWELVNCLPHSSFGYVRTTCDSVGATLVLKRANG